MPNRSQEQLDAQAEVKRRMANTRFGYQKGLATLLERFLGPDEAKAAEQAAHDRDFETFEHLTSSIKPGH